MIKVSHRTKNDEFIVKFKGRPSREALFANRYNLKEKSTKELGFSNENTIFIKSHSHLTPKSSSSTSEINAEH